MRRARLRAAHPPDARMRSFYTADTIETAIVDSARHSEEVLQSVAIIGMAGRFPGADDLAAFWRNIAAGIESVETVDDAQLRALGVDERLLADPRYVKRTSRLSDVRGFDAELFDISPREAEITDPQHRLLLEAAYEAIEHAGYNPFALEAMVGVYAGVSMSDYLIANIAVQPDFLASLDGLQLLVGSDKSYACTRISHKLNLTGPCVAVDSACSTSLVAVHMAAKALLTFECDMALAGGAKVAVPHGTGYLFQPGSILSPDGSCRPFDATACGTVHGSGVGMVLLKRLADALEDGDIIHAVIRGSAINNDGNRKIGFTAPGVQGQARVIAQALAVADVDPSTIGYVESHGTGTSLGDPIEIEALTEAFREAGHVGSACALGSLKGNVGHLDVAAGIAGLIKATLALQQRALPPSIGYRRANPEIEFDETPFFVNQTLTPWNGPLPRRAGVSSFGIGGTNAHVVLEEAPAIQARAVDEPVRPLHLLRLSARSPQALAELRARYVDHLTSSDMLQADIADIAFTANTGRAEFAHRLTVVGRCRAEVAAALADPRSTSVRGGVSSAPRAGSIAFLFTGQGAQYVGLARELYATYRPFRRRLDAHAALMAQHLPLALTEVLWGAQADHLGDTRYTQPALFALQLALAETWRDDFGVHPDVLLGHSVGEVSAACFAGAFCAADGMRLICARAAAMEEYSPAGTMLSLPLSVTDTRAHLQALSSELAIAAINGPRNTVVSGGFDAIATLRARLDQHDVASIALPVQRAFHSPLMEPALNVFRAALASIVFHAPSIPMVSNVTGRFETTRLATADYWVEHARATVQFDQGMRTLHDHGARTHIEIGPGATLVKLGRGCVPQDDADADTLWIASLDKADGDWKTLLDAIARLHVSGVAIDWRGYDAAYARRRATIPTYPFQRRPHWCLPDAVRSPIAQPHARASGSAAELEARDAQAPLAQAHDTTTDAAADPFAARVAALWRDLLGVAHLDDNDDFFALGGHSLLLVQLVARVERDFGIAMPMNAVVQNPRLAEFVVVLAHLAECGTVLEELPTVQADPAHAYDNFPLVDLQQAFYLGRSNEFGLGGVSTHLYFELAPPDFDPERFVSAWNALIARHGMLRAIILDENEQRVLESVPHYPVERYDYVGRVDALDGHLASIRDEMSHQVRPADQWPLFDVRMTRESEARWRVHFSIDLLMLDVRSNQILFRDLDMLYQGEQHALPELPIEFRDYVLARRGIVEGERQRAAREYWMERVPTMPLAPNIPMVANPAELHKPSFARRLKVIETKRWHRLRRSAQGIGVTPSVLLMTIYGLVIARWSKRPDFTLNVTLFDRLPLHPCVNQLVGDFTTLTLMSLDYSSEMPLKERARAIQRQLWRDVEHSSFSGLQVLRELTRHHGSGEQVTMPVVFTSALPLDSDHGREIGGDSLFNGIEDGYAISQTPQVWIDHVASEEDGQLILSWDAIESIFPAGMLDDMFDAYVTTVSALADSDELWHAPRIDLLPERQRAVRVEANATSTEYPKETLAAIIYRQALATPEAPAVLSRERSLSYRELYARASYWANALERLQVRPDELVAVLMEKGWQQAVAALAIQMAGAAYMPIDAHQPRDRRQQLIELGQPRIAFTQSQFMQAASDHQGLTTLCINDDDQHLAPARAPSIRSNRDLGCVLFTSGSTGVPKGVMIEHLATANTMIDVIARFEISRADRALAVSSLGFDLSVFDMFAMLAAGGALVVPAHDELKDPAALAALIRDFGVTVVNSVPAMIDMIVDHHEISANSLPESLRLIMMGGDFIPVTLPGRIWALGAHIQVKSMGGPTETATYSVVYPVQHVDLAWPSIPYGKPMQNRTCHILDHNFEDRPEWAPGEIWIGSMLGNARGYWNDPERTAASFVRRPHSGEKMFRTGDVGRYLPDGNIEILGRSDFQVKVNGYRVELGEIEALLGRDPNVRRAIVAAKEVHAGSKQVVAYLQLTDVDDAEAHVAELRTRCIAALPDYMVPSHFVILDSFPLSPNGKIDRAALPVPRVDAAAAIDRNQAARNDLERKIADVWCAVLEIDAIGVFESFLELGGHSLVAARVATRLREALGVPVSIRTIFENPNVAALADAIRSQQPTQVLPRIVKSEAPTPVLSYAQQRLWFIDRFERATADYAAAYNMPIVLSLRGHIDDDAMQRALAAILARHDVLRTGITEENGKPVARVAEATLPWQVLHVPADADPQAWTDAAVLVEFETPFDLAAPPLLRGLLIHRDASEHVLVIGMHHIVTDAWSAGLLLQELQSLYAAELRGEPANLSVPALQYADFAAWQRQVWDQNLMGASEAYWLRELSALPAPLQLPSDRPRTAIKTYAGDALSFEIDATLTDGVHQFTRNHGATPFMAFMAAFHLLLHRYTGTTDILVGTDAANRFPQETEAMLGFFINQLVIRTGVDPGADVTALLHTVRDKILRAQEHESMPFDRLLDRLQVARDPSTTPLFQVKLNMLNTGESDLDLPGLVAAPRPHDFSTVQYDLVLTLKPDGNRVLGTLQYRSGLFERTRMQSAIGHYLGLLRAMLATPAAAVGSLDYLSADERGALLAAHRAQRQYPQHLSIDRRVSAAAARFPDAVALSGAETVSYAALERQTDALAAWLVQRVPVGARVGLYFDVGAQQVIAILAVLKAGAAYVPLDPHAPADRIEMILEDSAPVLLLSDNTTIAQNPLSQSHPVTLLDELELVDATFESRAAPELPAYVIYTSGTTGRPNGVVVTHAHVGRLLDACQDHYRFSADDVWTLFHSYVFDFTVWELWGALCHAGRLVIVPYWVRRSPPDFWSLLVDEGVTVLSQTPSAFRQLMHVATAPNAAVNHALRWVVFGGEALELQSLRPWFERFGDTAPRLVNMYGITETTVHVTLRPLGLADLDGRGSAIGAPLDDLDLYLLDAVMQPVPVGVEGELYVGGAGLAQGYLARPALTARRFVPDPFSAQPGMRLYRTGDIARRTANGELEYVGRIDHQVKIRGHRVELGEVEFHLARHPAVAEALVVGTRDPQGNTALAAYVVGRPHTAIDIAALRAWLQERISDYMVPAAFITLDAFPLTINGKVDRRALPSPDLEQRGGQAYVEPTTVNQIRLAGVLRDLLAVSRIGLNDNFFEIGGHSLLATQLVSHSNDEFGVQLNLRTIFEHPTVRAMAVQIESALLVQRMQHDAETDPLSSSEEEFLL